MDIRPDYANIEQDGKLVQVDPEDVAVGDTIVIKAGEKIPLDGVILEGSSAVDTAALTGESLPRDVVPGDDVVSGCINQSGLLKVRVTKVFGESTVAKILDLVENSSSKKARAESFITRFARYYTPVVVIGAVLLAVLPPLFFGGDWSDWLQRAPPPRIDLPGDFVPVCFGDFCAIELFRRNRRCIKAGNFGKGQQLSGGIGKNRGCGL